MFAARMIENEMLMGKIYAIKMSEDIMTCQQGTKRKEGRERNETFQKVSKSELAFAKTSFDHFMFECALT